MRIHIAYQDSSCVKFLYGIKQSVTDPVLQMASLAFDATVTAMTLWKAFRLRRSYGAATSPLIQTFLQEGKLIVLRRDHRLKEFPCLGIFYFVFISIANLVRFTAYFSCRSKTYFLIDQRHILSSVCVTLSHGIS